MSCNKSMQNINMFNDYHEYHISLLLLNTVVSYMLICCYTQIWCEMCSTHLSMMCSKEFKYRITAPDSPVWVTKIPAKPSPIGIIWKAPRCHGCHPGVSSKWRPTGHLFGIFVKGHVGNVAQVEVFGFLYWCQVQRANL